MLHFFHGSDEFSLREEFRRLKADLNIDGALEANTVTFAGPRSSAQEVIAACDTVPFLGDHRLVVVEGLFRRGKGSRDIVDEEPKESGGWDALVEYVDRMPETTVLALIRGGAGGSVGKALRSKGEVHYAKLPDQKVVSRWIRDRAKSIDLRLEGRAVGAIADLVGNDTWQLANELDKLSAYSDGNLVTESDVRQLIVPTREHPPWDVLDPMIEGRGAQALKALRMVLEHMFPLAVMAMIQRAYRQLAIVREMLDSGASSADIGQRVGLRGFPLDKVIGQASGHTSEAIRAAYARMIQADVDIKTGVFDLELSLELLVTDLATSRVGRSAAARA